MIDLHLPPLPETLTDAELRAEIADIGRRNGSLYQRMRYADSYQAADFERQLIADNDARRRRLQAELADRLEGRN